MQYPSQHWPQNAAPPVSGAGGQPSSGGGGPHHPNYGHHGHGGAPPPPQQHPHPQGGWGHHPQQAPPPPPPSHHSAHQGMSRQLPPPMPTMPLQPSPPGGIFRERSNGNGSGSKLPPETSNGYPPPPPHIYDGHPPHPHGYSHGPPQGYGYSPHHSAQGGQQPPPTGYYNSQQPPGYYGTQHHHSHHGHPGPPPEHSQWSQHPSHGPPPGPPPNSSSQWEQHQHSGQSRRSDNPPSSEAYYSSHPSSSYSRRGLPPPPQTSEVGPPTPDSSGSRVPYIPSRGGEALPPPSQQSHGKSSSSSSSHHGPQHSQPLESSSKRTAPPPHSSLSGTESATPLPHQEAIMPPLHHPHGPPPPSVASHHPPPATPHGYPSGHHPQLTQPQQHLGGGPPTPRHPNPPNTHSTTTHSTPSTARPANASTAGAVSATSSQTLVPPHHYHTSSSLPPSSSHLSTPGAFSTSTTSYTDDEKGRGSYKCGRCGVPKKGHVRPYQPKVKRRPEDAMPEMKCVSTQVEMDEFMTLRRLNIEIQGYPESYAAEPMDMVGAEVGHHPPPHLLPLPPGGGGGGIGNVYSGRPMVGTPHQYSESVSGPPPAHHLHAGPPPSSFGGPFSPANSSSHLSGPPSSLPPLSSSLPSGSSFPPYSQYDPYPYASTHHAAPRAESDLPTDNVEQGVPGDENNQFQTIKSETKTPPLSAPDDSIGHAINSVEECNGETSSNQKEESNNAVSTLADEGTPFQKSDESPHKNDGKGGEDASTPPCDASSLSDPIITTKGSLEAESATSPMKLAENTGAHTTTDVNATCDSTLSDEVELSNTNIENVDSKKSTNSEPIESAPDNSTGNGETVVTPLGNDTVKPGDLSSDVVATTHTEDESSLPTESIPHASPENCGADSALPSDDSKKRDAEDLIPCTETVPMEENRSKRQCVQSAGNDSFDE